jgi:hypothetical protein
VDGNDPWGNRSNRPGPYSEAWIGWASKCMSTRVATGLRRLSPGDPRGPEAERGRNGRQVDVPEVVRLPGGEHATRCIRGVSGLRWLGRAQHPADRRRPEVQTRTGEDPGDPDSPHRGAKHFQPPDQIGDELGEPIHRFR